MLKEHDYELSILCLVKLLPKTEGKIQIIFKQKKTENISPSLKQLQKEVFKEGGNSINGVREAVMSKDTERHFVKISKH